MQYGCCRAGTARSARGNSVSYVIVTHFDRLDCVANAKINLRHSLYIAWSSCSDLTNPVRSRSQAKRRGSAT